MFPMILGVLLALLGAAIVRAGYAPQAADEEAEVDAAPDWRGWGCIIGGLLAFIALGKFGGACCRPRWRWCSSRRWATASTRSRARRCCPWA